ncbi:MAG: cyclic-di-AMP receptor, partial [Oscillospiraceae bacterium]
MKLLIAIVNKDDTNKVSDGLMDAGFIITKLATTGGFLRSGNTTMIMGVSDEKLDE